MTNDAWTIHASGSSDHKKPGNTGNAVTSGMMILFTEEINKSVSLLKDPAMATPAGTAQANRGPGMNEDRFNNPSIHFKHKSEVQFSQTSKGFPSANQPGSKGLFGRNRRYNG